MSNNNNPFADLIKDATPVLIASVCVLVRFLPAIFEKNKSWRAYEMEKACDDVQTAINKVGEMHQMYTDRINNAK